MRSEPPFPVAQKSCLSNQASWRRQTGVFVNEIPTQRHSGKTFDIITIYYTCNNKACQVKSTDWVHVKVVGNILGFAEIWKRSILFGVNINQITEEEEDDAK
jgi:hypothetical protein